MLRRYINQFTRQFKIRAYLGTDFGAWTKGRKIDYALVLPQVFTDSFTENMIQMFEPTVSLHVFTWSLLHEIGHIETATANPTDETQSREVIQMIHEDNPILARQLYYALPSEFAATEWAVNYAENNQKKILAFERTVLSLIPRFYDRLERNFSAE